MKEYLSTYKDLSLYTDKELQELIDWAEDEACALLDFQIKVKYVLFQRKAAKKQTKEEGKKGKNRCVVQKKGD